MRIKYFGWVALVALVTACDSPLDVDPTASIDAGTALSTPRGIELGMNGAYRSLTGGSLYGVNEMVYPDLYANNLDFTGTFQTDREVALKNISASNTAVLGAWGAMYDGINRANALLAAIPNVSGLSAAQQDIYRGEALFIRSLHYAILARYFGGVPIVTEPSSGVSEASLVPRNTLQEVYAQIQSDLQEAVTLLPTGRVTGRATRDAANALLARVYLEDAKYSQARDAATAVISSSTGYSLVQPYRSIWTTKNSAESIFELQYSINHSNSQAFWYFPQGLGGRWGFSPSLNLYNAFEAGDTRRDASIGIHDGPNGPQRYGFKYFRIANGDDNVVVLRLAEMYLIRAEANMRLGAPAATVRADLDAVRARAGLLPLLVTVDDATELTDAILQERRVEQAFEGQRFFDLRRLGRATTVLAITPDKLLWPIPHQERVVNPNLEQNPGY